MNLGSAPRKRGGFRLLTNLYMEKQYVKLHNNGQATVFAISNRGAGGEAPCKKNVVILRSARRPPRDEGSRAAPIYKRGAVPEQRSLI